MRELIIRKKTGITICLLLLIITTGFFVSQNSKRAVITANIPSQILQNQATKIPVIIDTKDHIVNAVEIYLNFDPSALKVESVSKNDSFIQVWITDQPAFSNTTGAISFAGGLPTPGFSGRGTVGSVVLTPLKAGSHRLTFDTKTRILLNDGLGSSVALRMRPIVMSVK